MWSSVLTTLTEDVRALDIEAFLIDLPHSFWSESILHTGTRMTQGFHCGMKAACRNQCALVLPTHGIFLLSHLFLTEPTHSPFFHSS